MELIDILAMVSPSQSTPSSSNLTRLLVEENVNVI